MVVVTVVTLTTQMVVVTVVNLTTQMVVLVAFSALARILGELSTIYSPDALFQKIII